MEFDSALGCLRYVQSLPLLLQRDETGPIAWAVWRASSSLAPHEKTRIISKEECGRVITGVRNALLYLDRKRGK